MYRLWASEGQGAEGRIQSALLVPPLRPYDASRSRSAEGPPTAKNAIMRSELSERLGHPAWLWKTSQKMRCGPGRLAQAWRESARSHPGRVGRVNWPLKIGRTSGNNHASHAGSRNGIERYVKCWSKETRQPH